MANTDSKQAKGLPQMQEALPTQPELLNTHIAALETWKFINTLYEDLAEVPADQHNRRNRVRRENAPGILLGLQMLLKYSMSEIAKIDPESVAARRPSRKRQANEWISKVAVHAASRFQRWTADTRKILMRRTDPNNNRTVLDLIHHHQRAGGDWVAALAAENISATKACILDYNKGTPGPSLQHFKDPAKLRSICQYGLEMVRILREYMTLKPDVAEVVGLDVEKARKVFEEGLAKLELELELRNRDTDIEMPDDE